MYRYAAVFQKLGIAVDPATAEAPETPEPPKGLPQALEHSTKKWIGIKFPCFLQRKNLSVRLNATGVCLFTKRVSSVAWSGPSGGKTEFTVWESLS